MFYGVSQTLAPRASLNVCPSRVAFTGYLSRRFTPATKSGLGSPAQEGRDACIEPQLSSLSATTADGIATKSREETVTATPRASDEHSPCDSAARIETLSGKRFPNESASAGHTSCYGLSLTPGLLWCQSAWKLVKLPFIVLAVGYASFWGYNYYQSGFVWRRTKLRVDVHQRRLWRHLWYDIPPPKPADTNAEFSTGLPSDLSALITLYFLQLDLDKANGVRRSDILALLQEGGIVNAEELPAVKDFVNRGKGRFWDEKRRSGCQLQEVLELIEQLLIGLSLRDGTPSTVDTSTEEKIPYIPPGFKEQLHEELAKQTRGALGNLLASTYYASASFSPTANTGHMPLCPEEAVEPQALELAILENEHHRLSTFIDEYIQMERRSGLTDAQQQRVEALQTQLHVVENDIARMRHEHAAAASEKRYSEESQL